MIISFKLQLLLRQALSANLCTSGRHVSNLRSLQKGNWNKNQLELMYTLYANGSNSIWEHTLLDPLNSGKVKRKPQPQSVFSRFFFSGFRF